MSAPWSIDTVTDQLFLLVDFIENKTYDLSWQITENYDFKDLWYFFEET